MDSMSQSQIITKFSMNRRLWYILFIASLCSLTDIAADSIIHTSAWSAALSCLGLFCFAAFKSTALTLAMDICSSKWLRFNLLRKCLKALVVIWIAIFIILALINVAGTILYDLGISRKLVRILSETNISEITEFMPGALANMTATVFSWQSLAALAILTCAGYAINKTSRRIFTAITGVLTICGMIYMTVFMITRDWGKSNLILTARTAAAVRSVRASAKSQREYMSRLRPLQNRETLKSKRLADNITIVIGESASRDHMSLYGYPLKTTPLFDTMRDSLAIFSDALASSTSTAENIPRIVSFMSDAPDKEGWWSHATMTEIFKSIGYHTAWISNQERSGVWNNVSSALSSRSDLTLYVGSEDSEDHLQTRYDDRVITPYNDFIGNGRERHFAIVHLLGSHTEYSRRYPRERAHFSSRDTRSRKGYPDLDTKKGSRVAEYDNSILFTDSILSVMVRTCAANPRPSLFVYLSDHGENVYDNGMTCGRDRNSVRIPMIIYLNKAYREANPEQTKAITESTSRPFSSADLIHLIMTATGTTYCKYNPTLDILSPQYSKPIRYVDEEPYTAADD